ncbi:leucyl aminopeptidase [Brevirhabdus pacifica]|uniref:Probable cytosol aminopeptidase n=1 Tax=Brevirhabdus pacifica TaxID=1267768 RepID=A0A1U7DL74_9RHOB|nr:leucyl aminopeptidase [Brevirhabdus pacifica]APX90756.1 leucyl aminopeptidase [Brevirhabdus pacifica]OWU79544.1 aminopeptidase A [Loktanella sp. 22II-4b]PJJ87367.1 leucyl aminopeptidase [Brevirhabdus pacifica]
MTKPVAVSFDTLDTDAIQKTQGRLAVFATCDGKLDRAGRRVNRLTRGALERFLASEGFEKLKEGEGHGFAYPSGMEAEAVMLVKLDRRPKAPAPARKAGATLAKFMAGAPLTVLADGKYALADVAYGVALRAYAFTDHKTRDDNGAAEARDARVLCTEPEAEAERFADMRAVAEGVFLTRDLVSAPSNILTTTSFAERLQKLEALGAKVEILEEPELEKLGMGALLGVGQGSDSPSKVAVIEWQGGEKGGAPFALVGKGVVFDTGGISLKPAAGMEDMTMDMGGAGVVAGVMHALASRKARANVVALIGLVENMPDGKAQRPGDVVTSMKGDTIEVINTDAEGRLVLADVLWYAQERFKPSGIVDLATLTGAIIIGLGHENAGVFSNDDTLCNAFLKAAGDEGEGAWRMPLSDGYDKLIKSDIADIKNVGGRAAGSITAAQFLQRFVKPDVPWIHLDIAGTASVKTETDFAPKGATGWGVRALDRMIRDYYEG